MNEHDDAEDKDERQAVRPQEVDQVTQHAYSLPSPRRAGKRGNHGFGFPARPSFDQRRFNAIPASSILPTRVSF